MSSRQDQNTGTRDVREAHRFDEQRLEAYLSAQIEGFGGPLAVTEFKGGQSNPTYRLDTESGSYVLRRKPPGKLLKSAHAVDREFRVISALHASGFPVPKPYVMCEDETIIGTTFYVMECVEGRIFWELDLPGLAAKERTAIYDHVNETLAALHTYELSGDRPRGLWRPRKLLRTTDITLGQAVSGVGDGASRVDGSSDRLAT